LTEVFGYREFRGQQAEIIADMVAGRNVLTVMPTGAGKSLCFQIPALMMDGLAIVVSPLISLMQNQVEGLNLLGIEAASLNSAMSPEDSGDIWRRIRNGTLKLLYVSPEKLMTGPMQEALGGLKISLFAIDEAHCISQWGASFRPEYEALSGLRARFPDSPLIALTATADQTTREQICQKIFAGDVKTYLSGFDRPNISLHVEIKNGWKQQLLRFLKDRHRENGAENGIVYCLSRKKTEQVAALLVEKGTHALPYHAGMSGRQRQRNLNRFMAEDDLVIVATIAFGMGIDKPDIRFVFHTDLPASPEAYYQEIGRAGRDGAPALAHMLYGMKDIALRRMFIDNEESDPGHKRREHQRLNALLAYCEAPACRRVALLRYFGDEAGFDKCNNCDLCRAPKETVDATVAGRKFLSAMLRTGENFGVAYIADILIGKTTARIAQRRHDRLPTFGVGQEFSARDWKSIARQLMAGDFIIADMEYGALKMTPAGRRLLKNEARFSYRPDIMPGKGRRAATGKPGQAPVDLPESALGLFQALKDLRREIATGRSVPAYIIFADRSLREMALETPLTLDQFGDIHGVGAAKKQEFGPAFIRLIDEYREN